MNNRMSAAEYRALTKPAPDAPQPIATPRTRPAPPAAPPQRAEPTTPTREGNARAHICPNRASSAEEGFGWRLVAVFATEADARQALELIANRFSPPQ